MSTLTLLKSSQTPIEDLVADPDMIRFRERLQRVLVCTPAERHRVQWGRRLLVQYFLESSVEMKLALRSR